MSTHNKEAAEPVCGFDLLKVREAEMRQQAITVNAGRKPKFGDRMRNPWAGETNPHRDGIFIRARRTTGRMNPGLWYDMTDGKGEFWTSNGDTMMFIDNLEAPATEQAPKCGVCSGSGILAGSECGFCDGRNALQTAIDTTGEQAPAGEVPSATWDGLCRTFTWPDSLHDDSKRLVMGFAAAMAGKLAAAERKYGYSNGWTEKGWLDECRQHLIEHLAKGDPRDVANYCAFLWWHNEPTAAIERKE